MMDVVVCVLWGALVLLNTQSSKASTITSPNDLFVTSTVTDPKEPIMSDLPRPPSAPEHISSTSPDRDGARGEFTTSLPAMTSSLRINLANTKIADFEEPIGTDVVRPQESVTSPKTSANTTEGSLDSPPSNIPLKKYTTIIPGSPVLSSTNLSEIHQNASQSTVSEMIRTVYSSPPSPPLSTLQDFVTGSGSLGKENRDEPSELDVGDEDSAPSPSPLDPLLAGLISIFIVSTALLSIILCLKFRQQGGQPEFHRLQDLPMTAMRSELLNLGANSEKRLGPNIKSTP